MKTISERLKEALSLRDMKQADLVEKTSIGKSSISTYLSGSYEPKQRNIYKIAKALSVSESWLMGLDVPISNVEYFNKILKHYRELNHLTQEELNIKLNLDHGIIKRLENKDFFPDDELLDLLAEFFYMAPYALLDDPTGEIFNRIKKVKDYFQLSIEDFADKIDTVPDMYRNWENGVSKSYYDYLDKISSIFDVPLDYLWLDSDYCTYFDNKDYDKKNASINGIISILEDIYGKVEVKHLNGKFTANKYYIIGTEKGEFILYDYDIEALYESTKASLPFLVNRMKDTRSEVEILADNSIFVKNELLTDKDN